MKQHIKRCPHCGGEAIMYANYAPRTYSYMIFVKCGICGATGKITAQREDPAADNWEGDACARALEAWNMRTGPQLDTQTAIRFIQEEDPELWDEITHGEY